MTNSRHDTNLELKLENDIIHLLPSFRSEHSAGSLEKHVFGCEGQFHPQSSIGSSALKRIWVLPCRNWLLNYKYIYFWPRFFLYLMCLNYLAKYTCSTIQILDRLFLSLYRLWILDYIHLAEEPLQFPWNLHCLSSIKSKSSNSKQFCSSWIFVISLPFPATKITVEWQWRIIFSHEIIYNFYFLINFTPFI